jgi:hypothetical protein
MHITHTHTHIYIYIFNMFCAVLWSELCKWSVVLWTRQRCFLRFLSLSLSHTHTHTHIHIYIFVSLITLIIQHHTIVRVVKLNNS